MFLIISLGYIPRSRISESKITTLTYVAKFPSRKIVAIYIYTKSSCGVYFSIPLPILDITFFVCFVCQFGRTKVASRY